MATVSFTIATTSISKSWGQGPLWAHGGSGCLTAGRFGVDCPQGWGPGHVSCTGVRTDTKHPCPGTRSAPAAPARGRLRSSGPFLGTHGLQWPCCRHGQAAGSPWQGQPRVPGCAAAEPEESDPLTPLRLMASLSSPTTLFPSAPEALKPLVQFRRMPWNGGQTEMGVGCR